MYQLRRNWTTFSLFKFMIFYTWRYCVNIKYVGTKCHLNTILFDCCSFLISIFGLTIIEQTQQLNLCHNSQTKQQILSYSIIFIIVKDRCSKVKINKCTNMVVLTDFVFLWTLFTRNRNENRKRVTNKKTDCRIEPEQKRKPDIEYSYW